MAKRKANKFAAARKVMATALRNRAGLRQGYVANVAMLIYDDQKPIKNARGPLKTVPGCNVMAEKLLGLIFEDKR